MKKYK